MKKYKAFVKILPKAEVLDVEARAVKRKLEEKKFLVKNCRIGKFLELEIEAESRKQAEEKIKEMASLVLFNPLVEEYDFEIS